jgi:hypothetical protein
MLRGGRAGGQSYFTIRFHGEGVDMHDVGVAVDDVSVNIGVSGGGND